VAVGWAVIGLCLTAVLPRGAAIALVVAGPFIVEPLLGQLLSNFAIGGLTAASFLPYAASTAPMSVGGQVTGDLILESTNRLDPGLGAVVFAGYILVAVLVGWRSFRKAAL
jgi:hypothetical protein